MYYDPHKYLFREIRISFLMLILIMTKGAFLGLIQPTPVQIQTFNTSPDNLYHINVTFFKLHYVACHMYLDHVSSSQFEEFFKFEEVDRNKMMSWSFFWIQRYKIRSTANFFFYKPNGLFSTYFCDSDQGGLVINEKYRSSQKYSWFLSKLSILRDLREI